jgi:glycine/D-amino acid oxidase-like deaminating enzyme
MQGCDGPQPLDIFESTFITTAYALAKRGFAVTLFERHRYAAMETSFANGGQLSASNAEVCSHWSTVLKGLKWMLKSDAPLLVNGVDRDIRAHRIRPLVEWVEQCFPRINTLSLVPWAGLRPMMPNMMPRVGQGKAAHVFYNTGHGHLGWTLSAVTAELVSDTILKAASAKKSVHVMNLQGIAEANF